MITKEIDIYLIRDVDKQEPIRAVQEDSGNEIVMHIKDTELPSGTTAQVFVLKPSGSAIYSDNATVTDNDITFMLAADMIAESGTSWCQVHLECDGEVITTFRNEVFVEGRLGTDASESASHVDAFDKAVADGIEDIEAAAAEALDDIEAAADSLITFTDPNEDGNIVITIGST